MSLSTGNSFPAYMKVKFAKFSWGCAHPQTT